MLLQENGARFCTEGKVFTIGGIICANDESEYAGLCGTVMEIRSGDDCETENDTPDIYCAFDPPTSENMVLELEGRFSALYGEPKTMADIALDNVVMAPEMLESSAEPLAEGVDLSGKMEAVADIFAKVLQTPDGALRALRAFPCAPADEEAAAWAFTPLRMNEAPGFLPRCSSGQAAASAMVRPVPDAMPSTREGY